jgi:hypothetical protein
MARIFARSMVRIARREQPSATRTRPTPRSKSSVANELDVDVVSSGRSATLLTRSSKVLLSIRSLRQSSCWVRSRDTAHLFGERSQADTTSRVLRVIATGYCCSCFECFGCMNDLCTNTVVGKYASQRSVVAWQGELANPRFSHAVMSVLCRRQRKNPAKALPRAKVFVVLFAGGFLF